MHGVNDANVMVVRIRLMGDVARTYVGDFRRGLHELQVPNSVGTDGWNINPDGSVVGHYDSPDGRRYGFIARPDAPVDDEPVVAPDAIPGRFNYTFESIDVPGAEFLAVTASSDFEDYAGNTRSPEGEKEIAFTLIDGVDVSRTRHNRFY